MKLSPTELEELNNLLSNNKIDIPDFRRTISPSGNNYTWLQRNIITRNPGISNRLKDLLCIKVNTTIN